DPVVDDGHGSDDVRVSVVHRRRAVRRPARMRDANVPAERLLRQLAGQIVELPFRAAADELAMIDGANAGAIVPTIFEPLQSIEQARRDIRFSNDSDDSAHTPSLDDTLAPYRRRSRVSTALLWQTSWRGSVWPSQRCLVARCVRP